jgi:hypothetical protein
MDKYISELDTLRFGFKVAKINSFTQSPLSTVQSFKQLGVSLVISRVATGNFDLIDKMEQAQFRLKDVQVTYSFDVQNHPLPTIPNGNGCYREFLQKDTPEIVKIAADSFRNYGHYSTDERTKVADSAVIYQDWARRSCLSKDWADHIVVAEVNGMVAGFLSLKVGLEDQAQFAAGVMGAVAKDFRKEGIFQGINIASLHWAKMQSLGRVENNVLVTNFPVNNTYISLGFKIIRSEATFHCWLG